MIDPAHPDYTNTPASPKRPAFHYEPRDDAMPLVSIITPYYNLGPVFQETVLCIQRMSFTRWEWIVVDDGSTDPESLAQLERLQASESRARVIHQTNGGPGVARNRAVAEAKGQYLLQLDGDDLVEPTFVEKALWVLETQPQFAACGAYDVTFGAKNYLWSHGFQEYEETIDDNRMTNHAVIRRDAWIKAGGYDERVSYQHADWDFWLNLAEVGLWGYTIEEYLVWYRMQARSLIVEVESDIQRAYNFRAWLHAKHRGLRKNFPRPGWSESTTSPQGTISEEIPFTNRLAKPEGTKRILCIFPWLERADADRCNLDLIRCLYKRGYEFTVVTTSHSSHPWKSLFAELTPDIFCLQHFLKGDDYPRFLNYVIESRQIDAVFISNSEFAYLLAPYLRACHPHIAILDYNHLEEDEWRNGGYPAMSLELGDLLDLRITCTNHLKNWMVECGAEPDRVVVCGDAQQMASGVEAAFSRACELVAMRDSVAPDLERARYAASLAIEHTRKAEAAERHGADRGKRSLMGQAQRWRERYLPIGSQRYERYKRYRKRVRRLVHLMRSTPRYVRTGKVFAVPVYIKASVAARYAHRRLAPLHNRTDVNNQMDGTSKGSP